MVQEQGYIVHVNRLRYRVQPEASPSMNTSHKEDWQLPQTDHFLLEGTLPVLVEHPPPEDPGVEVPEEPDLPALEHVRQPSVVYIPPQQGVISSQLPPPYSPQGSVST